MRRFCAAILLLCLLFLCGLSCTQKEAVPPQAAAPPALPRAKPAALLQAGEFPLWFQFTAGGPVLIETIDDACFSAALVPWPLAPHIRFTLAQGDDLLMVVNGDGFLRFSPQEPAAETHQGRGSPPVGEQIGLYRFSGGDFWRQYTVGAFVLLDETAAAPMALLYRDDRFIDSDAPLPVSRLWTFDLYSGLTSRSLSALNAFAAEDGWDIDALRRGGDGFWYFRAVKKTGQPELHMFRLGDLAGEGEKASLGAFQNAALPEPLSAAPVQLGEMIAAVFAESGGGIAAVVSPEFQTIRSFAADREKPALLGFYSGKQGDMGGAFLLAASPQGNAFYLETNAAEGNGANAVRRFVLPSLPEGFAYTGIGMCGDTIIASWEEQDEYSIGAAGFMAIRF